MITRREVLLREKQYRLAFRPKADAASQVKAFEFYTRKFAKIAQADKKVSFELRPAQRRTATALARGEHVIVLKARQIGFSTLFSNWALWKCLTNPSYRVIFLSKNQDEAVYLLSHAKFAYDNLPFWLRERLPRQTKDNEQEIRFSNNSSITSLPSRKDAARGRTVSLLVADEFASLQDQEEAWAAMLPTTDVGGQAVVLSTAKGSGDLFETLWNKAITKSMNFTPLFFSWREAFDEDYYAEKARSLLPWQLAQEHPSSSEEAFVRSGNAVFDLDMLKEMTIQEPTYGDLAFTDPQTATFVSSVEGPFRIFQEPQERVAYVIGVDIAEGLEHGDRSVATVLRVDTRELCAIYTSNRLPPWEFAAMVAEIGYMYNTALIGPERNHQGLAFIRALVELDYFPIFKQHRVQARRKQPTEMLGWMTTPQTKGLLISDFDQYMHECNVPDEVTVAECKTYKRNEIGRMSGSPHDDHVMSYALAVQMLNHAHNPEYRSRRKTAGYGTFGWIERKLEKVGNGRRVGERLVAT
jgi:hypothetical protein